MKIDKVTCDWLLELYRTRKIPLEGNVLKVIDLDGTDEDFKEYINESINKDKETRRKRLDITKQVQEKNRELQNSQDEVQRINNDLKDALSNAEASKKNAEEAKDVALNDLDIIQKKSQTELIGTIVKVALGVIMFVGVITTIMYIISLFMDKDTQIIGSTWSNMFGILLTNAFSIIGTIMGVKYASESKKE
jgi:hypothetical protein